MTNLSAILKSPNLLVKSQDSQELEIVTFTTFPHIVLKKRENGVRQVFSLLILVLFFYSFVFELFLIIIAKWRADNIIAIVSFFLPGPEIA